MLGLHDYVNQVVKLVSGVKEVPLSIIIPECIADRQKVPHFHNEPAVRVGRDYELIVCVVQQRVHANRKLDAKQYLIMNTRFSVHLGLEDATKLLPQQFDLAALPFHEGEVVLWINQLLEH